MDLSWKGETLMKTSQYFVWIFLFLPLLSQCQEALDDFFDNQAGQPPREEAFTTTDPGKADGDWTVMVYIAADNNLDPQAIADIQEMEQVGSSDRLRITVFLDRGQGWKTARRALILPRPEADVQSMDPSLPTCEDLGEIDSGSVRTLQDFVGWSLRKYPSRRTTLILWNHGGGWRSLDCLEIEPDSGVRSMTRSTTMTREICSDDTSNSVMYMKDVRESLEQTGIRFDLMCFDACLMGMVEVAYEMKGLAPYVVASEQTIPGQGYDYTPFLRTLAQNPGMDGRALGMEIVDAYARSYSSAKDVTLALVDSRGVAQLVENLNQLVRQTGSGREGERDILEGLTRDDGQRPLAPEIQNAFQEARKGAVPPMGTTDDPYPFYDLGALLASLSQSNRIPAGVRTAAGQAQRSYEQAIIKNFATQTQSRSGMAIYFPESPSASHFADYTARNILFAKDCLWPLLIQGYAGAGGGGGVGPGPVAPPPSPPIAPPIPPAVPPGGGGFRALIVGIDQYASLPRLKWPLSDSQSYQQMLTMHGWAPGSIRTLTNMEATKQNIRQALFTMASSALPGDVLFFAFSGHGAQATDFDDEYDRKDEALCPYEARLGDPQSLFLDDDLRAVLEINRNVFWVIFLGCSHSGEGSRNLEMQFFSEEGDGTRSGDLEGFFRDPKPESADASLTGFGSDQTADANILQVSSSEETRGGGFLDLSPGAARDIGQRIVVFSACKSFQIAWGEDKSLFMQHLLNGYARGALAPGASTYGDMGKYVNRRLALMNFLGRTTLISGVAPPGAVQVRINGEAVRQDPNVEVPALMKNLPFLINLRDRGLVSQDGSFRSVPDPIDLNEK
ncbi:MAG: hypothetical protein DYH02_08365 [Candidatus Omnitrophica bacterium COP1]|nr:hypothetical protein [Candidatus Omnitrophica bacterium COP1]